MSGYTHFEFTLDDEAFKKLGQQVIDHLDLKVRRGFVATQCGSKTPHGLGELVMELASRGANLRRWSSHRSLAGSGSAAVTYNRVVPRDLFNESKLLKCLGRLAILIFTGRDQHGTKTPERLSYRHDGEPFSIEQRPEDGGLYCPNVQFFDLEEPLTLYVAYNDKGDPYPLLCDTGEKGEIQVLHPGGELTGTFRDFLGR